MDEQAPTWPEMVGRMRATGFATLAGRMRYRVPGGEGAADGTRQLVRVGDKHPAALLGRLRNGVLEFDWLAWPSRRPDT